MHINGFDYTLPEHLIAQYPLAQRDTCRLLHLDRCSGSIAHAFFHNISDIVHPGDRLVLNDTSVIPARLFGKKRSGAHIEFLFTQQIDKWTWKALIKPARKLKIGASVQIEHYEHFGLRIEGVCDGGQRIVSLVPHGTEITIEDILHECGRIPLPHYIRRDASQEDKADYQTIYARKPGAVAAPTAGLHFTPELMKTLEEMGVHFSYLTLHVGIGTFRPVKAEDPRDHDIHEERYELSAKTVDEICSTQREGGRIIAVGTTVVRVLEHCSSAPGVLHPSEGTTKLMILPPYEFKIIDGIITNFHLPKSTLLMLVCAFGSQKSVLHAYSEAVKERYRFFSYGDAIIVL